MKQPYVKLIKDNHIATIEFFHPKHNSLPSKLLRDLIQAINEVGNDQTIKVIVLQSFGNRTFCAGASFEEMSKITTESAGKDFFAGFANLINTIRLCPKIIIGRVQGKAVGGGVGLIAASDYCLATKYASIKLSELDIGIGPFVISPVIKRKIGLSSLTKITLESQSFFSAEWSKNNGLYSEIYENQEELDVAIKIIANKVCTYNPQSVIKMKRIFWEGTENWDDLLDKRSEISGKLAMTSFTKSKLFKFKNKD